MDVLGIAYHDFAQDQRDHVCAHHPREANFKEGIIEHFARGIIKKLETTFGNVKADVLALKDPENFVRGNFCSIIPGRLADLNQSSDLHQRRQHRVHGYYCAACPAAMATEKAAPFRFVSGEDRDKHNRSMMPSSGARTIGVMPPAKLDSQ